MADVLVIEYKSSNMLETIDPLFAKGGIVEMQSSCKRAVEHRGITRTPKCKMEIIGYPKYQITFCRDYPSIFSQRPILKAFDVWFAD